MEVPAGVRRHYQDFYDGPDALGDADGRPVLVALGNCQAESHRLALDGPDVRSVRVPALHELTADDVRLLLDLLRRADHVVTQPVGDGYRGFPLGTAEVRRLLRPSARLVVVPSLRFAGQHPYQLVVHPPGLVDPDPPVVAYHDLRTAVCAVAVAEGRPVGEAPPLTVEMVRAVADDSVAELERRERRWDAVRVSDLFAGSSPPPMRTVNHPGDEAFLAVAVRLREALGLAPGRPHLPGPLLDSVHAPVEEAVVRAYPGLRVRRAWTVEGVEIEVEEVARRQLAWYRERPDILAEVVRRSAVQRERLGLAGTDL